MLDECPVALAFKRGQANLIADWLNGIGDLLKTYDDSAFKESARLLGLVAMHVRKSVPQDATLPTGGGKAPPKRIDPNSMIPRPVAPKGPSGPIKLNPHMQKYADTLKANGISSA